MAGLTEEEKKQAIDMANKISQLLKDKGYIK